MATNRLRGYRDHPLASGNPFPITPHNTNYLPAVTRCLIISSGGDVAITDGDDNEVVCTLPAGAYPIVAKRIKATGTTATGITGIA